MDGSKAEVEHYIRYFCLFVYWRHLLKGKREKFPVDLRLRNEARAFETLMNRLGHPVAPDEEGRREAYSAFAGISTILESLHQFYRKQHRLADLKRSFKAASFKQMLDSILAGRVWLEPITRPDTLILGLKREENKLTFEARMAAILSLWNSANIQGGRS